MPGRNVTISRAGHLVGATGEREALRALAQGFMKVNVTSKFAAVTDNSGGNAPAVPAVILLPGLLSNTGIVGSNAATVADVNAGLAGLQNALKTLYVKANAIAVAAGFAPVAFGGGGTDGNGTVASVPDTVGGATSGPDAAPSNVAIDAYNQAVYNLAALVNRLTEATGDDNARINPTNYPVKAVNSLPNALPTTAGAAQGTSAVSAADWANALSLWQNAVAAIANRINAVVSAGTPRLIAIR